jgi:cystathionine beta-lyase/cystathionine gamma-synthase
VKVKEALIRMKLFFEAAVERGTVATSAKVSLIVGSILALINYGDRILLHGDLRVLDWFKLAVTYCVPDCGATYGAARYATRHARDSGGNTTADST